MCSRFISALSLHVFYIFYLGDSEDKSNLGVHPVGKGGRHLSIPFDSATANGDISEYKYYNYWGNHF